jgi:type IV secretion system protein VirB1
LTVVSTTAASPQKDDPQNHPHRRLSAESHRRQQSALNPVALHDNTTSRSYAPETVPEAVALAANLIHAQGHSVDLGLMQINSKNLDYLGLREADAFDACHSIRAAGNLFAAISRYNTGSPTRGLAPCNGPQSPAGCGYTTSTLASIQQVKGMPARQPVVSPRRQPQAFGASVLHSTTSHVIAFGG